MISGLLASVKQKKLNKKTMKKQYAVLLAVLAILVAGTLGYFVLRPSPNPTRQSQPAKAETYIDVRTDQEWEAGHLNGAMHLDVAKIQAGQLPNLSKDTPIALYCRTGHRAGIALQILEQSGFIHVRNAGGLAGLQSSGKKVCLGATVSCK